jgi:hypothetical protein
MSQPHELICALRMKWQQIGVAVLDTNHKIEFPKLPSKPGLYRLNVTRPDGSEGRYVGETDNLQRRFAHYRNPGPTQATNIRLNALCMRAIANGGVVALAVVTDEAWVAWGSSAEVRADFGRKSVRRLFEKLAVSADKAIEVEDLNK